MQAGRQGAQAGFAPGSVLLWPEAPQCPEASICSSVGWEPRRGHEGERTRRSLLLTGAERALPAAGARSLGGLGPCGCPEAQRPGPAFTSRHLRVGHGARDWVPLPGLGGRLTAVPGGLHLGDRGRAGLCSSEGGSHLDATAWPRPARTLGRCHCVWVLIGPGRGGSEGHLAGDAPCARRRRVGGLVCLGDPPASGQGPWSLRLWCVRVAGGLCVHRRPAGGAAPRTGPGRTGARLACRRACGTAVGSALGRRGSWLSKTRG